MGKGTGRSGPRAVCRARSPDQQWRGCRVGSRLRRRARWGHSAVCRPSHTTSTLKTRTDNERAGVRRVGCAGQHYMTLRARYRRALSPRRTGRDDERALQWTRQEDDGKGVKPEAVSVPSPCLIPGPRPVMTSCGVRLSVTDQVGYLAEGQSPPHDTDED